MITLGKDYELMVTQTVAKSLGGLDTSQGMKNAKIQAGYYDKMSNSIREMAKNSQFTALQVAEAAHFWAKTGADIDKIAEYTKISLDVSVATGTSLEDTADMISDMLGSYGVKTKEGVEELVDMLVKTTMIANMDLTDAFESTKQAASLFTIGGAKPNEFLGAIAMLASGGIKGEQSGTHMKNIMARIISQTNQSSVAFKKMGVTLKDEKGNLLPYLDVLEQVQVGLEKVTKTKGKKQAMEHVKHMFGMIALPSVMMLLQQGIEQSKKASETIKDSLGYSAALKRIFGETVGGAMAGIVSAIEDVSIGVFEINKQQIRAIFEDISATIRKHGPAVIQSLGKTLKYIIDNYKEIAHWIGKIAIGIGIFVSLSMAMGLVANMLTIISLLATINPFVLIAGAIAILITALYYLSSNSEKVFAYLRELWTSFPQWVQVAFVSIGALVAGFLAASGPIGLIIGAVALIIMNWKKLGTFFTDLWAGIVSTFDAAVGHIGAAINNIIGFLDAFNIKKNIIEGLNLQLSGTSQFGQRLPDSLIGRGVTPQTVSPSERVSKSIKERRVNISNDLTIRDQTGRAKVTRGNPKNLNLIQSGSFP